MAFKGVDYFCVDSLFSEQELMVRQTARRFAEERIAPLIRDCYRDARFPSELIPEMAELGFYGANLEGYGCAGMSNVEYGLIMQELERVDSGIRSFVSVQGALVMYPILTYGSEEQKQKWLPRLQSGQAVGCFGLTEPDFGSNPGGLRTRARHAGGHRGSVGARGGRHPRISGGARDAGIHVVGHSWEVVDAGVGYVEFVAGGLPGEGERPAAWGAGIEGGAGLPDAGAFGDRMRRVGRGHGVL